MGNVWSEMSPSYAKRRRHFFPWVHLKSLICKTGEEAEEDLVATFLATCVTIQDRPCMF